MKIVVKTVTGKAMEMLDMDATDTVRTLKTAIQAKFGVSYHRQRLIFAGRLLEDNRVLRDYQISKECSVFLVDATDAHHENQEWWNIYAACANEIHFRLAFHEDFDEDGLRKHISNMQKYDLSFDQQIALQGLMLQVKNIPSSRRKGSYIKELDEGLLGAIKSYQTAIDVGNDCGPFIIHGDVPYIAFEDWYKRQESAWRIGFQFLDSEGGVVLLYGDPSFLHEGIAQWFGQAFTEQSALLINDRISKFFSLMGSAQLYLPIGNHKEPDFCIQPRKSPHQIPPFVGEVAYANESLEVLKGELVQWTVDGAAKIAYGVKVSHVIAGSDGGTKSRVKLRFLERIQGQNYFNRDIDFSPDSCRKAGEKDFQIKLPLKEMFVGVPQDDRLLHGEVVFDLFELQELIKMLLENNAVDFVWHPKAEGKSEGSPLLRPVKRC